MDMRKNSFTIFFFVFCTLFNFSKNLNAASTSPSQTVPKVLEDIEKEKIERNILEAIQKAHESSTATMKERMNDLTGGLNFNLPGLENNDS